MRTPRLTRVLQLSTATGYRLTVPGSAHLAFLDAALRGESGDLAAALSRYGHLTVL